MQAAPVSVGRTVPRHGSAALLWIRAAGAGEHQRGW